MRSTFASPSTGSGSLSVRSFSSSSFGCRVNATELEMLNRNLINLGFTHSNTNPEIFLINTCAVTAKAEREARQLIYQTRRKWPHTKIVVTGCAAAKWIKEGVKVKGIDEIIDNTHKEHSAEIINKRFYNSKPEKRVTRRRGSNSSSTVFEPNLFHASLERENWDTGAAGPVLVHDKFLSSGRLLIKIQDGCQRFCTFCIVPYLRGQPKSKSINDIISTIQRSNHLTSEVILTAINTQAFGYDTGEKFIDLINRIIGQTKVPRISFGSIHPWSINDEFISFYNNLKPKNRLVNFFHIPLQSGSNKILSLMKRGYTREEFMEKLDVLNKVRPLTFIGTDIIVGFLEETDRDFADTYEFLEKSPISKFHIFRFSRRESTAAYFMAKRLHEPPPAVKMKRAKALADLSRKKYQAFLMSHVGKTFPALILESNKNGYHDGLLDNQIPVRIKTNSSAVGNIQEVTIKKVQNGNLVGAV